MSLLILTPFSGYGKDLASHQNKTLRIEELIIAWQDYRGNVVNVVGSVRCYDEIYCEFVSSPKLHRIVSIDITMLPVEGRRHAILDCHEIPCEMLVTGSVMQDDLMAITVLDGVGAQIGGEVPAKELE